MSFLQVPVSSRRGSSHALVPWNSDHACSASGPTGGHAFSGEQKRRTENAEQNAGHASDMRSRTLLEALLSEGGARAKERGARARF